jgi:hypothetical protein
MERVISPSSRLLCELFVLLSYGFRSPHARYAASAVAQVQGVIVDAAAAPVVAVVEADWQTGALIVQRFKMMLIMIRS